MTVSRRDERVIIAMIILMVVVCYFCRMDHSVWRCVRVSELCRTLVSFLKQVAAGRSGWMI